MALQIRRGTDAERLALSGASAPLAGELLFTTDTKPEYFDMLTSYPSVSLEE